MLFPRVWKNSQKEDQSMDDKLDRNTDVSAEMKKTDSPVQAVPEKVKIEIRDLDLY